MVLYPTFSELPSVFSWGRYALRLYLRLGSPRNPRREPYLPCLEGALPPLSITGNLSPAAPSVSNYNAHPGLSLSVIFSASSSSLQATASLDAIQITYKGLRCATSPELVAQEDPRPTPDCPAKRIPPAMPRVTFAGPVERLPFLEVGR